MNAHDRNVLRIALTLPAYEDQTVSGAIEGYEQFLPHAEIDAVNNDSKDRTRAVAAEETFARRGCERAARTLPRTY